MIQYLTFALSQGRDTLFETSLTIKITRENLKPYSILLVAWQSPLKIRYILYRSLYEGQAEEYGSFPGVGCVCVCVKMGEA